MDEVRRFALVAALLAGSLIIGIAASDGAGGGEAAAAERARYTVSQLLAERPLEQPVLVAANVSRVLGDYTADAGTTYQQFRVTDGNDTVKVFCSTAGGRVNVSVGDRVRVPGTFQEYYGTYEIYTRCSSVRTS